MSERVKFTMTQEQYDAIIAACQPVAYMIIGSSNPSSPQENANNAWIKLGLEMGFDGSTVQPWGSNKLDFTAIEIEKAVIRSSRALFREAVKPLIKYLCENHHPHTKIIVEPTCAEIVEGTMSFQTEEFIVD